MQTTAQLYRYNADSITITEESEAYFETHFQPEQDKSFFYWLNFHSLENRESILKICQGLDIDKLIQENLFLDTKRPRVEEFDNYMFFSIVSALPTNHKFELKKERISFIVGQNYLISFQDKPSDHFPNVRDRLENKKGKVRFKGPDFLLFRLLEAIIDNYLEVVDQIETKIEKLEHLVLKNVAKSTVLQEIESEKRKLMDLRKTAQPMRELLTQFEQTDHHLFDKSNGHYFLELKGTCMSLMDDIDVQKQILEGMDNLYYAVQGQRMNEIMKVLTIITVIFIPLTFIVGVYGMNFENMPELKWKNGYYYTLGLMTIVAGILIFVFYKRGWLRKN